MSNFKILNINKNVNDVVIIDPVHTHLQDSELVHNTCKFFQFSLLCLDNLPSYN